MNKRAEAEGLAPRKPLTPFIASEVTDREKNLLHKFKNLRDT